MARAIKRDKLGRFAGVSGTKVATSRPRYVAGSFQRNLDVGQVGSFKRVKAGAEFRTPGGRAVRVAGSIGYHGKSDRRFDVTPSYDKKAKALAISVRPNSARVAAATRRNATAGTARAATPRSAARNTATTRSAGRKVRRSRR